jgi:hypothetical protein
MTRDHHYTRDEDQGFVQFEYELLDTLLIFRGQSFSINDAYVVTHNEDETLTLEELKDRLDNLVDNGFLIRLTPVTFTGV